MTFPLDLIKQFANIMDVFAKADVEVGCSDAVDEGSNSAESKLGMQWSIDDEIPSTVIKSIS